MSASEEVFFNRLYEVDLEAGVAGPVLEGAFYRVDGVAWCDAERVLLTISHWGKTTAALLCNRVAALDWRVSDRLELTSRDHVHLDPHRSQVIVTSGAKVRVVPIVGGELGRARVTTVPDLPKRAHVAVRVTEDAAFIIVVRSYVTLASFRLESGAVAHASRSR